MKNTPIPNEELEILFKNTNFGPTGKTDKGRRGLMVECVLKYLAGFSDGSTITNICIAAGLIDGHYVPTPNGISWLFWQLYKPGGETIIERLKD